MKSNASYTPPLPLFLHKTRYIFDNLIRLSLYGFMSN